MLKPAEFFKTLLKNDIDYFCGVPDSLLKDFCAYISDNVDSRNHTITANEGNAIAMAAGYNLATGKVPLVYMQNSGLGNSINPLVSLADREVYSVPMLLLIGWRGQPGVKDEPQHIKQGKVTLSLLDSIGLKYQILQADPEMLNEELTNLLSHIRSNNEPAAFIVKKNTFDKYTGIPSEQPANGLTREEAIKTIVERLEHSSIIVSTTGKASRELYEIRNDTGRSHESDFLTVGSMGHTSSIALSISHAKPDRHVVCLDGDGSLIMHMGALTTVGCSSPRNFKHVLLNNGAHESVGGQPTAGFNVNFCSIASACGYKYAESASNLKDLKNLLDDFLGNDGPSFLEVKLGLSSRPELGRPKTTPLENKNEFIRFIRQ